MLQNLTLSSSLESLPSPLVSEHESSEDDSLASGLYINDCTIFPLFFCGQEAHRKYPYPLIHCCRNHQRSYLTYSLTNSCLRNMGLLTSFPLLRHALATPLSGSKVRNGHCSSTHVFRSVLFPQTSFLVLFQSLLQVSVLLDCKCSIWRA